MALLNETDPGFLAAKRSLKTFAAVILPLFIFYNEPKFALLAVISALLFSRSQYGSTIEERKFTLLLTGAVMTLIAVPISFIGDNEVVSVIFVFLFAFAVFFLIGLKIVPDFPAIVILSVSVVEMAFSNSLETGLKYSGMFAMVTALVYVLHFWVFPTKPRRRLQLQTRFMITGLEKYLSSVTNDYPDLETAIAETQKSSYALRKSINEFRRLWQLFHIQTTSEESDEGRLMKLSLSIEKIYENLVMIWQLRAGVWDSPLFNRLIINEPKLLSVLQHLTGMLHPERCGERKNELDQWLNDIVKIQENYLAMFHQQQSEASREEWVAVFNALGVLQDLLNELKIFRPEANIEIPEFSAKKKTAGFLRSLSGITASLNMSNPAFRFGLRSAIIVGTSQAFFRFFEPEFGYWLVLFAVLLIRPNLGISIRTGLERFWGTIAGGLVAFAFLSLVQPEGILFYATLLIAAFLMIWMANLNKPFYMVIALTFLIICVFSLLYAQHERLIVLRIIYTTGVVVMVIALSSLLWPEKARKNLALALATSLEKEKIYFNLILKSLTGDDLEKEKMALKSGIDQQFKKMDDLMEAAKNEVVQVKTLTHGIKIRIYIKRLNHTLRSMDLNAEKGSLGDDAKELVLDISTYAEKINRAFDSVISALQNLSYPADFPELEKELDEIILLLRKIRKDGSTENHEMIYLWRNSAFVWNFRPLIKELEGIKTEIELKMNGL